MCKIGVTTNEAFHIITADSNYNYNYPAEYEENPTTEFESRGFSSPVFYTDQRYSEIANFPSERTSSDYSSSVSETPSQTYDALKKLVAEKRARLLSDEPLFREPLKPLPFPGEKPFLGEDGEPPYSESSIRRLDGPFVTYQDLPKSEPEEKKRRMLKVKLKKPTKAQTPAPLEPVEEPIDRLSRYGYESEPERRQDYYREDFKARRPVSPPAPSYDPQPTPKPSYFYKPVEPEYEPLEPRHSYEPEPLEPRSSYKPEPPSYGSYEQPSYHQGSYDSQPSYNQESYQPYKQNPDYSETNVRRQGSGNGFVDRPNFLDSGFSIPNAFKDNLQAPAFADFRPPFGGFSDFLSNFPANPFSAEFRSNDDFFSADINTSNQPLAPVPDPNQFAPRIVENLEEPISNTFNYPPVNSYYDKPAYKEAPSSSNGFYSNDYVQDYTQPPKPVEPVTTEAPKEVYKPKYEPVKEEPVAKPAYKPTTEQYKYKVETYRTPIGQPDYEIKTTTPAPAPPKPAYTESSVYYKPLEPEETSVYYKPMEDTKLTPGPIYYKPIDETTTPIAPVVKEVKDEVATAPKPPPKGHKRPDHHHHHNHKPRKPGPPGGPKKPVRSFFNQRPPPPNR